MGTWSSLRRVLARHVHRWLLCKLTVPAAPSWVAMVCTARVTLAGHRRHHWASLTQPYCCKGVFDGMLLIRPAQRPHAARLRLRVQGSKFSDAPAPGYTGAEGLQQGYGELMGGNPGAGAGGPMGGGINGSGGAAQMGQMGQMGGAQMGPGGVFSEEMSIPAPMVRPLRLSLLTQILHALL